MKSETVLLDRPLPAVRSRLASRWVGVSSIILGLGAAFVALLGPLGAEAIRYHASAGAINQIMGGDVAGLVLVAPLAIIAGVLILRGHRAGPMLALGPSAYALYTYAQLALGGDVLRYPGNSERFFPLFTALFVVAAAVVLGAWSATRFDTLEPTTRRTDVALGIFFLTVAAFLLVGLHLPGLIDAWQVQPTGPEYLADPNVFWLVKLMDLGIVVPALVAVGVGVLRRAEWAQRAKYAAVGWFALLGSSVAGMAVVMQASGDPAGSALNTAAFGTFALVGLTVATLVYLPLFRRGQPVRP